MTLLVLGTDSVGNRYRNHELDCSRFSFSSFTTTKERKGKKGLEMKMRISSAGTSRTAAGSGRAVRGRATGTRVTKHPLHQKQQQKMTQKQKQRQSKLNLASLSTSSLTSASPSSFQIRSESPITTAITASSQTSMSSSITESSTTGAETTTKSLLKRINTHPTLTAYRKLVYATLLSVPAGRWTTYAALSKHLASSPRAIGNAMRTNPFAPAVPCHRVLATDGTLGGYKGSWVVVATRNNTTTATTTDDCGKGSLASAAERKLAEKKQLLMEEGVVFDEKGKPMGGCFCEFQTLVV